jgi:voltage-gated potassium channel
MSIPGAFCYTTVTPSTTGYGDITPVTTAARLTNALLVTPMRFLFALVLVGTTIQALTERSRTPPAGCSGSRPTAPAQSPLSRT